MEGKTRFGEEVIDGVVMHTHDGSIDELLAAREVWSGGQIVPGPGARSTVVIETSTVGIPLVKRVHAHREIIRALPKLWMLTHE